MGNIPIWRIRTTDASFGVTSPIFLDNINSHGKLTGTLAVPSDQLVTSFSSKSELAVNLASDGKSLTFVGYHGGPGFLTAPNQLDVSNSSTPGAIDPTNPVTSNYYRSVAEVDANGQITVTDGNATAATTDARQSSLRFTTTWLEMTITADSRRRSSAKRKSA